MNEIVWTHQVLYKSMLENGFELGGGPVAPYLFLYPQSPNCAILYAPNVNPYKTRPIHLKSDRPSWRADVFELIEPAIDTGIPESQGWTKCRVIDWKLLAEGPGVTTHPPRPDMPTSVHNKLNEDSERTQDNFQLTPLVAATPNRESLFLEEEESRYPEGAASYRRHRHLERDTGFASKVKQRRLEETGRLSCDACGFDFLEKYGDLGMGYIEAHHKIPVSLLDGKVVTQSSDIALVCSNCHRMLHRGSELLSVEELRDLIQN